MTAMRSIASCVRLFIGSTGPRFVVTGVRRRASAPHPGDPAQGPDLCRSGQGVVAAGAPRTTTQEPARRRPATAPEPAVPVGLDGEARTGGGVDAAGRQVG